MVSTVPVDSAAGCAGTAAAVGGATRSAAVVTASPVTRAGPGTAAAAATAAACADATGGTVGSMVGVLTIAAGSTCAKPLRGLGWILAVVWGSRAQHSSSASINALQGSRHMVLLYLDKATAAMAIRRVRNVPSEQWCSGPAERPPHQASVSLA